MTVHLSERRDTVTEVPRDRWGRPLIIPVGGGKPVAYTRVSTFAKALDDLNNLMAWKQRKTAEGFVRRPDLLTRTAGVLANGDPDTDWTTKKALNEVCEQATEAAGSSRGSSAGTGFHQLTEALDRGEDVPFVPPHDKARLDAYREATNRLTPLGAELFVVNDALGVAGTFDRLWRVPAGFVASGGYVFENECVVVGDLKTGKSEADYPLATTVQIATYARSQRYDPEKGHRWPVHNLLTADIGLLVHMPPSGGCEVIPLDLNKGWHAAQVAHQVHHDIRRWKASDLKLSV